MIFPRANWKCSLIKSEEFNKKTDVQDERPCVAPTGIEPVPQAPEARVLSIVLRRRFGNANVVLFPEKIQIGGKILKAHTTTREVGKQPG